MKTNTKTIVLVIKHYRTVIQDKIDKFEDAYKVSQAVLRFPEKFIDGAFF